MVLQWRPSLVGGHIALSTLQGVVRMVVVLGKQKLDFLDTIPFLFCRLSEPGIRDKCLRQFHEVPAAKHDKVSRYMLGENTRFLQMIQQMNPDGTGMQPLLQDECDSIGTPPSV